jgi:peptide deformylase
MLSAAERDRLGVGTSAIYHNIMPVRVEQLSIVHWPDPVLRTKAAPVDPADPLVRAVALRMIDLMHEAGGCGLAAPQVGLSWRLFVANDTGEPGSDQVFINPQLLDPSEEIAAHSEGCLSIPHVTTEVRRPKAISIHATDIHGQPLQLRSDQLAARIWQHETDHLDGVLILDRMPPLDRLANRRALKELEAKYHETIR